MTGGHTCLIHGDEYWDESELMTGTYSFCARCSKLTIEARMEQVREELAAKGFEIREVGGRAAGAEN